MGSELEDYTDEQTGIRLTVERQPPYDPEWPHLTAHAPEPCTLTDEEVTAAIRRLVRLAGYDEVLQEWVERQP